MRLFPHVLTRVSGGSFTLLRQLECPGSLAAIYAILDAEHQLARVRTELVDQLYRHISTCTDSSAQKKVLNLKRDVFNDRAFDAEKLALAKTVIPASCLPLFEQYITCRLALADGQQVGETEYERELGLARGALRELAADDKLQKGLLLSSQALYLQVQQYLNRPLTDIRRKDAGTEQGLLKYITRMYAKTSPFSTFTNLAMGTIRAPADQSNQRFRMDDHEGASYQSHIRLNNALLTYLKGLMQKTAVIYHHLLLRTNPTIRQGETHYTFLTNSNNREAFQRIKRNAIVDLIIAAISRQVDGMAFGQLIDTITAVEQIEATSSQLEVYINQLLDYGLLEYNWGVSGTDPDWNVSLEYVLTPLRGIPIVDRLLTVLHAVRETMQQYASASASSRKDYIQQIFDQLQQVCFDLHELAGLPTEERQSRDVLLAQWMERQQQVRKQLIAQQKLQRQTTEQKQGAEQAEATPETGGGLVDAADAPVHAAGKEEAFKHLAATFFYFKPEQLLYEDTSLTVSPHYDPTSLSPLIESLDELLQGMRLFTADGDDLEKYKHFFLSVFGEAAEVEVLTFYERFYRDFKQAEVTYQQQVSQYNARRSQERNGTAPDQASLPVAPDLLVVPALALRNQISQQWFSACQRVLSQLFEAGQEVVHLTRTTLATIKAQVSDYPTQEPQTSYGAFLQCFTEQVGGTYEWRAVINNPVPGYSKLISRFLHLFDPAILQDVRSWNNQLAGSSLFVENCDASSFNANLHPPLLGKEIWIPGSNNTLAAADQIPVTDLVIVWLAETGELALIHKPTQRRVFIFDLGFQALAGRSPLFQLLNKFTRSEQLLYHPILTVVNAHVVQTLRAAHPNAPQVVILPRIVFDERLILQRKTWMIPKQLVPERAPTENDWSYFQKINAWRLQLNIPDQVFITITSQQEVQSLPQAVRAKLALGRDDYKPQYMSFRTAFLVSLFEKLVTKAPMAIKLEEMLPTPDQLLSWTEEPYVTESVVQWYK